MAAAFAVLVGGLVSGCSDTLECKPLMPEGAVYQVTLGAETTSSQGCHVVKGVLMSPFTVTAGRTQQTAARSDCSVTPAAGQPLKSNGEQAAPESDVKVMSCVPSETEMLGVYCAIHYNAGCDGHMQFSFAGKPAATGQPAPAVNWGAQVIDNVVFRIEDFTPTCFANNSNCKDEYTAKLERIK